MNLEEFAGALAASLSWTSEQLYDAFKIAEAAGQVVATLLPKARLSKQEFRIVCGFVKDHGGPDYIMGSHVWTAPITASGGPSESEKSDSTAQLSGGFQFLPLSALLSMPFQLRERQGDVELVEMAESIREHGVLEPIRVRPRPSGLFEIVMGGRRVKATEMAGLLDIPAVVQEMSDQEAYECAGIENVQRKDISDMDKGRWLKFMIEKFAYTQRDLAKKIGKSEAWLSQHLALVKFNPDFPKLHPGEVPSDGAVVSGPPAPTESNAIQLATERQLRELARAPEETREQILAESSETGKLPSSREIERRIKPPAGPFATGPVAHIFGPDQTPEATAQPQESPTPKTEKIDTGFEFTCPECGDVFQILHVKRTTGEVIHKLEAKR